MTRRLCFLVLLLMTQPVVAASHCVILQYHHFSEQTPAITSVSVKQFEDHLQYIQDNGFQVMALRDVVFALRHQRELPEKCVSLTVDDAYISVYQNAYPRLKQRAWPFTVFVSTQEVDNGISSVMNWQQMREMSQHGASFENHGHAHLHMIRKLSDETDQAWLKRIGQDIEHAQQRLIQEIGIAPTLLAYTFGEYSPALMAQVQGMGLTAFGQHSGPAWPAANFGALPRFPMAAQYADMEGFSIKINSLPLLVVHAEPSDPLVELGNWRPTLQLSLAPGSYSRNNLRCYVSGSDAVEMRWSETEKDNVSITPTFDLKPGRHRSNCTMPAAQEGQFHWYSHNWFIRHQDGSWYAEY
ncbi:MAG: polysaccharide deacetylase family protein [Gammaproteobacteria bacterium]|nr:polysaccharide deacetylase family protein [Gammaproteobacteria bacterium]MBL6999238.1 polysaccharide deacetylase family protein [Gammaproteobacteria bacterium]